MLVSELLVEGKRRKDLNYQTVLKGKSGEIDKVIVQLEGTESAALTKLGVKYKDLKNQMDELAAKIEPVKNEIKVIAEDLFDPMEDILTRIVETKGLTVQLAKAVQPSEKTEVDYEKAFNELVKTIGTMVPELQENLTKVIECAIKQATSTKKVAGKASALTIKEGVLGDFAAVFKALKIRLAKWLNKYDKKLDDVKSQMSKLQAMQARIDRKVKASTAVKAA